MKKSEAKIKLFNLLDNSELYITEAIEWEGREINFDETLIEKQRLVEEIMKIVYPK